MIKKFEVSDICECAEVLMSVYNNELWMCKWSIEKAKQYLLDYAEHKKFIGYTLWIEGEVKGAIFCHEKIWWDNNEIFVDEMFISPEIQRRGYGTKLLNEIEGYIKEQDLAGLTLSTNKYSAAPDFYRKNGFDISEHVMFMYKVI